MEPTLTELSAPSTEAPIEESVAQLTTDKSSASVTAPATSSFSEDSFKLPTFFETVVVGTDFSQVLTSAMLSKYYLAVRDKHEQLAKPPSELSAPATSADGDDDDHLPQEKPEDPSFTRKQAEFFGRPFSILHSDPQTDYGSGSSTLSLNNFCIFLRKNGRTFDTLETLEANPAFSSEELSKLQATVSAYSKQTQLLKEQSPEFDPSTHSNHPPLHTHLDASGLEYVRCRNHSPYYDAEFVDFTADKAEDNLMTQARKFFIDLNPQPLFSRSSVLSYLTSMGVYKYLEFSAIDSAYFVNSASKSSNPFSAIPFSKSEIFSSPTLSSLEKLKVNKFFHLILGDDYHKTDDEKQSDKSQLEGLDKTFHEFVQGQKLGARIESLIFYALSCLDLPASQLQSIRASQGIARLKLLLGSLGRYSTGPWIYPLYGFSDLVQSFVRYSAINSSAFVLDFPFTSLVVDSTSTPKQIRGMITESNMASGYFIQTQHLIHDPSTLQLSTSQYTKSSISVRFTLVLKGCLKSDLGKSFGANGSSLIIYPESLAKLLPSLPSSAYAYASPIFGFSIDSSYGVCPTELSLLYLWSTVSPASNTSISLSELAAQQSQLISSIVDAITSPLVSSEPSELPTLLFRASFKQVQYAASPDSSSISGLHALGNLGGGGLGHSLLDEISKSEQVLDDLIGSYASSQGSSFDASYSAIFGIPPPTSTASASFVPVEYQQIIDFRTAEQRQHEAAEKAREIAEENAFDS